MSNTTRNTVKRMLTITAMAMAIPVGAYAAGSEDTPPPPRHGEHHRGMDRPESRMMFKELNLTDAQKAQVKQIMEAQKTEMKASFDERRAEHGKIDALVESEHFDQNKASALIKEEQEKERAMRLTMLESRHKIYMLLTPEQRTKAKELRAKHENKMERKE